MLQIGEAQAGQTITVPVGQVIELRLKENPTTGFRWEFRSNGEPVCRVTDSFVQPAPAAKPPPGKGTTHVWRFECIRPGGSELALAYARPWEAAQPAATIFEVQLRVVP